MKRDTEKEKDRPTNPNIGLQAVLRLCVYERERERETERDDVPVR